MICAGLGVFFGAGWGGRRAAKTEEHRQELLSKRVQDAGPRPKRGSDADDDSPLTYLGSRFWPWNGVSHKPDTRDYGIGDRIGGGRLWGDKTSCQR